MREFLARLQAEYEIIAQNQIGWLEPGLSVDEVVSVCEKKIINQKESRRTTDKILKNHLFPMLDHLESISEEDEGDLFATAQKLSSYEEKTDPGLALRIYQGLLESARKENNHDKIIKYLYWCGITMHYLNQGKFGSIEEIKKTLSYFEEGASYDDRYHTFSDAETRKYIHRCHGNTSMVYYSLNEPEKAMEQENLSYSFWNSVIFIGKDLDFPWLSYFLTCLNHRYGYLVQDAHLEPDAVSKAELRDLLDLTITINKLFHTNRELFNVFGGTRYDFMLWDAQFLSGLISYDHLVENIHEKKRELSPDDYSINALYTNISLNSYLMFYAAKMRKLRDRKDEIIAFASKEAIERLSAIPMNVSPTEVGNLLQAFVRNLNDVFDPASQLQFVMRMTTFRHIPTYAHSIVVGKIALCLTEYLAKNDPAAFIGFMGIKDAGEVVGRIDELREFAELSGLCHDVGRITYVTNPFMLSRILTDEEYETVKRHTVDGATLLSREDGNMTNKGFIDIIKGHHRYYDNSGGYPEDYDTSDSEYKLMIDIIFIANALDAGTDRLSKAYTDAKSMEEICEEIISRSGTRYAPFVGYALKDARLLESIRRILEKDRKDAYYTAYLYNQGKEG